MDEVKEYTDLAIQCIECHDEFTFTAGEQLFFADKGLKNVPKRCKTCKVKKNERFNASINIMHSEGAKLRVQFAVQCASCNTKTTVPFLPTQGRPVYCRACFLQQPIPLTSGTELRTLVGSTAA